jgi:hypothetical protein
MMGSHQLTTRPSPETQNLTATLHRPSPLDPTVTEVSRAVISPRMIKTAESRR